MYWSEDGWGSSLALVCKALFDEQVDDDPDTNKGQDKRDPDPGRTAFPAACEDTPSPHLPSLSASGSASALQTSAEASFPVNLMVIRLAHLCTMSPVCTH
jgi:hypothetical protein